MEEKVALFWHRRDLRIEDNVGLYHAVSSNLKVLPIFIFDSNILDELPKTDKRVSFIYDHVKELNNQYCQNGGNLHIYCGSPEEIFKNLLDQYNIVQVYTNHDYEPYARERDSKIKALLEKQNVTFHTCKDQVILEKDEVLKADGDPYVVYTPYMRQWKSAFSDKHIKDYTATLSKNTFMQSQQEPPSIKDIGFAYQEYDVPPAKIERKIIENYHKTRDLPYVKGTSRLSVHLRFGTISIRELVRKTKDVNEKFLNELIWRDFYQMILWHFPKTVEQAFKNKYDQIQWRNKSSEFAAWKEGKTGYPIVDAGMRELNQTGYMHNRVRMIVASFLTKHLLIDWRWGEAYFAEKLMDFELASNVGGWQWAAGSGVDAAPYFRIFNPELQLKKFDPDLKYVRKWVDNFDEFSYPDPIVDHKQARERALSTYKNAVS